MQALFFRRKTVKMEKRIDLIQNTILIIFYNFHYHKLYLIDQK